MYEFIRCAGLVALLLVESQLDPGVHPNIEMRDHTHIDDFLLLVDFESGLPVHSLYGAVLLDFGGDRPQVDLLDYGFDPLAGEYFQKFQICADELLLFCVSPAYVRERRTEDGAQVVAVARRDHPEGVVLYGYVHILAERYYVAEGGLVPAHNYSHLPELFVMRLCYSSSGYILNARRRLPWPGCRTCHRTASGYRICCVALCRSSGRAQHRHRASEIFSLPTLSRNIYLEFEKGLAAAQPAQWVDEHEEEVLLVGFGEIQSGVLFLPQRRSSH